MTLQQNDVGSKVFVLNNYDTDSLQATQLCFLRGQSGAGTDFL
jgi:hypothetical protein